jgi:hypothetical protein
MAPVIRRLSTRKRCSRIKQAAKKAPAKAKVEVAKPAAAKSDDDKKQEAMDFLVETVEGLISERGSDEKIWGSMVKPTMQRRRPGFTESYYGYRSFKELIEDAQRNKLVVLAKDEKSGQYMIKLPL